MAVVADQMGVEGVLQGSRYFGVPDKTLERGN